MVNRLNCKSFAELLKRNSAYVRLA